MSVRISNWLSRAIFWAWICSLFLGLSCVDHLQPSMTTFHLGSFRDGKLDLDGDGKVDFRFQYGGYQTLDVPPSAMTLFLEVVPEDHHAVQYRYPEGVAALPDSVLIDQTLGWAHYGIWLASFHWSRATGWDSSWSGPWINQPAKNLALRVKRNGNYHYGWVKLSINAEDGSYTVHSFAVQPEPNTPILAGVVP